MLDHLLVDLISTMRGSLEGALLQRQAIEERFQVDVFLGDVSWETSYSLPGEEQPPRVRADLSVDWPTWSQTNYRSWSIGVTPDELPEVVIEVTDDGLVRSATTIEKVHNDPRGDERDRDPAVRWAVEATYEGSMRFDEAALEDPRSIRPVVDTLARWIASTLVQLADLPLHFVPPDPAEHP